MPMTKNSAYRKCSKCGTIMREKGDRFECLKPRCGHVEKLEEAGTFRVRALAFAGAVCFALALGACSSVAPVAPDTEPVDRPVLGPPETSDFAPILDSLWGWDFDPADS